MTRSSAWLATGRVANLPSVWTHVLTGALLGNFGTFPNSPGFLWQFGALLLLASLFYVGGCLLGDARDAAFDAAYRPGRPIPSGILSARSVARAAWVMLLGAWLLAPLVLPATIYQTRGLTLADLGGALADGTLLRLPLAHQVLTSSLLLAAIVSYAVLHKRVPQAGLPLMGACRGLLVIWAASHAGYDERPAAAALDWFFLTPAVLAAAAATTAFTIGFVLVARSESKPDQPVPARLVRAILLAAPLVALATARHGLPTPSIMDAPMAALGATIAIYLSWIAIALRALPRSKPAFVSRCLAGFCLLDACFLALASPALALVALAGFLLALGLQRLTPAT